MKKIFLTILAVLLLPLTIVVLILILVTKKARNNRVRNYLAGISVSDIDAITGTQFEEIVAYLFDFFGYKTKLTKRSGDYGVDIFANFRGIEYCIQTKLYYNHSVGSSAIQEINTAKNYYSCDYALVVTNSKYSKQAIDMANRLKVVLLDRSDLSKMLSNYRSNNKKFLRKYLEGRLCLRK
ncbi:MAG: restriction endonuclease [Clostridiales bacterium]|nr:restriction endonuclease [Clostridiales bacterium]